MVRKTILALLAAMLVMGLSSLSTAQEAGAKPTKQSRIERALAGLTLSADEKAKVDPVVAEYKEKAKAAKDRTERKQIGEEYAAKITPLLSDENKAKFEAALKAAHEHKKEGEGKKEGEAKKEGETK